MVYHLITREVYFPCVAEFVNSKAVSAPYCGNRSAQAEPIIILPFMQDRCSQ